MRKNKGSPGIDGMTVDELPDHLRAHWSELREHLLSGAYRPTTIFRELRARGLSVTDAATVAANGRRWWKNSATLINAAFPNRYFDQLGVPRLAS